VAQTAEEGASDVVKNVRREHPLAANGADFAAKGTDAIKAFFADWKTGNVSKRRTANAAVRGKRHSEENLCSLPSPGAGFMQNNRGPCLWNCGPASPDSVLTTAEDGLPCAARTRLPCGRTHTRFGLSLPMQYNGVPCR